MSQHLYVYGVTEAGDFERGVDGIEDAETIETVVHHDLAAIVSSVEDSEVDRTDHNLQAHDEVLRTVINDDGGRTVVPMGFGMVFENERTVKNVLRGARPTLKRALNELADTVELGIKVVSDPGEQIDPERMEAAAAKTLEPVSIATVENELFSDRLVLNRSYLVERDAQDAFGDAVATFEEEHAEETTVQYTGPWAPYNFVDIRIGSSG